MVRLFVVVALALLALPTRAEAQSFFAFEAPIAPEGEVLGSLAAAPVEVVRWLAPTQPVLRFVDADVELETPVELTAPAVAGTPHTHVVAGVRARTALGAGPWAITMGAGAWAPLRGSDTAGTRVALPPRMPLREATIPRGARGAQGAPSRAFDHPSERRRGFELACSPIEVRASRDPDAPRWSVPIGAAYRTLRARGAISIEVHMEGFVLRGFLDREPERCEASIGMSGIGSRCGDGFTHGLVFRVPGGTPLYASPTSTAPFAHTRREVLGRELLDSPRAIGCSTPVGGGPTVCSGSPPEPTGPTTLLFVEHDESASEWSFRAHVRLPVETLPRVEGVGGFGGCTAPLNDWPPRE